MGWDKVEKTNDATHNSRRTRCHEILTQTAPTTHSLLTEPTLRSRQDRTIRDIANGDQVFELWIYNKVVDGQEEPYSLVVAFDLSLRRRFNPNTKKYDGSPSQHHWGITAARTTDSEGITLTDEEAYNAVKDKCREFLQYLSDEHEDRGDELHIRMDAEGKIDPNNHADDLFLRFLKDTNITTRNPRVYPVSEYQYYQRREGTNFPDINYVWSQRIVAIA